MNSNYEHCTLGSKLSYDCQAKISRWWFPVVVMSLHVSFDVDMKDNVALNMKLALCYSMLTEES